MGREENFGNKINTNGFTKDNQPSSEVKKAGHRKKKTLKDLADALISGERLDKCKVIANKVGIDLEDNEFTLDIAMTLKQIEKAFDEGDTRAYQAAMDRLMGKAPQQITQDNTHKVEPLQFRIIGKDGKPT